MFDLFCTLNRFLFLAIFAILIGISSSNAFADNQILAEYNQGSESNFYEIIVSMNLDTPITAIAINMNYDKTVVKMMGCEPSDAGVVCNPRVTNQPFLVRMNWTAAVGVSGEREFIKLIVQCVGKGDMDLSLEVTDIVTDALSTIPKDQYSIQVPVIPCSVTNVTTSAATTSSSLSFSSNIPVFITTSTLLYLTYRTTRPKV